MRPTVSWAVAQASRDPARLYLATYLSLREYRLPQLELVHMIVHTQNRKHLLILLTHNPEL